MVAHGGVLGRERHGELGTVELVGILDNDGDGVEYEHQAGNSALEVTTDSLLETDDLDDAVGRGDAELVDELENGAGGHTSAANGDQGVQTGVVPAANVLAVNKRLELALGEHGAGQAETAVFALHGLVDFERLVEPLIRDTAENELGGAEGVGDALEAIAKAVSEIVGRVDLPLASGPVVRLVENSVSSKIPHLGVAVGNILLHAEESFPGLVFSVAHIAELLEVLLDRLLGVLAAETGAGALLTTALELDLVIVAVADVGLVEANQLFGEVVQLLEVVGRVGDLVRGEAEPAHGVFDGGEVDFLLGLGVGVVESEVAVAAVVLGEAEVDGDGLGVADVEETVRLGRETGEDGLDGALVVDVVEEALLEHGLGVDGDVFGLGVLLLGGGTVLGSSGGSSNVLLLVLVLLLNGLLCALGHALLELALGDHLARLLVENELGGVGVDGGIGQLHLGSGIYYGVGHDVFVCRVWFATG